MKTPFLFILFLSLLYQTGNSQNLKTIDFSYNYVDEAPVYFQYFAGEDKTKVKILIKEVREFDMEMLIFNDNDSRRVNKKKLLPYCVANDCELEIDNSELKEGFTAVLHYKRDEYEYYSIIPQPRVHSFELLDAFGDPFFGNYTSPFTDLVVKLNDSSRTLDVLYFQEDFLPADPPMGVTDVPQKSINPTRKITVKDNEVVSLSDPGTYLFYSSEDQIGKSICVEEDPFPKYNKLTDLKGPLVYITTKEEWNELNSEEFNRESFDDIWLDMAKFDTNASKAIRVFYSRVEAANKYFTSYKPGWMTDRGMVHIIYGQPDKVQKSSTAEIWEYASTIYHGRQKFIFYKKRNAFADNFTLRRKKEYLYDWNNTIEMLREGKIE